MKKRFFKSKLFLGATSLLALGAVTTASVFFALSQTKKVDQRLNTNVVYSDITGKPVSGLTYDAAQQLKVTNWDIMQSFFSNNINASGNATYSDVFNVYDYSSGKYVASYYHESHAIDLPLEGGGYVGTRGGPMNRIRKNASGNLVWTSQEATGWYISSLIDVAASNRAGPGGFFWSNSRRNTLLDINAPAYNPIQFLLNLEEKAVGFGTDRYWSWGTRGENILKVKISSDGTFDYWKANQNNWKNPAQNITFSYSGTNTLKLNIPELVDPNDFGYDSSNYDSTQDVIIKVYDADIEKTIDKQEALISQYTGPLQYFSSTIPGLTSTPGWQIDNLVIDKIFDNGSGGNNIYAEIEMPLANDVATKFQTTEMPYWYTEWESPVKRLDINDYDSLPTIGLYSPKISRGENSVMLEWNPQLVDWTYIEGKRAAFTIYQENEDGTPGQSVSRTIISESMGVNGSSISIGGIYPNESYIFSFEYEYKKPSWSSSFEVKNKLDSRFYITEDVYANSAWVNQTINTQEEFYQAFPKFDLNSFGETFLIYDPQSEKYLSSSERYTYTGVKAPYGSGWTAGYFPWVDIVEAGFGFKVGTANTTDIGIQWSQGGTFNTSWSNTSWLAALSNTTDGGGGAIIAYEQNDSQKRTSWQIETNSLGEVAFKSESTGTGGREGGYLLPAASSYNPSTAGVANGVDANFAQANALLQPTPYYFQLHRIISMGESKINGDSPIRNSLDAKIDNQVLDIVLDPNFDFAATLNSNEIRIDILDLNGLSTGITGNLTPGDRNLNLNLSSLTRQYKYKIKAEYEVAQDTSISTPAPSSIWNEEFEFVYDWFDSSQFSELEIIRIDQQSNTATIGFKVLDSNLQGEYIRNNFDYYVSYDYYGTERKSSSFDYDPRTQTLSTTVEVDWNYNYEFKLNIEYLATSNRFTNILIVDNGEDLSSNSTPFDFGNYQTYISFAASTTYNDQDLRNNTLNVNLDLANSLRPDSIRNNVVNVTITDLETNLQVNNGYIYWATGANSATGLFNNIGYGRYNVEIEYQFSYTIGSRVLYQIVSQSVVIHV